MIDIRKLKELVRLMVENDLTELDLRDSEEQVTMRRPHPFSQPIVTAGPVHHASAIPVGPMYAPAAPAAAAPPASPSVAPPGADTAGVDEAGLVRIESPMVGTFYAAPNPDAAPFVSVGSNVNPDTTVCIIEAMKIFNEIKAEVSGVIHKVLVKNGEPVEFGQPLFLVKPS